MYIPSNHERMQTISEIIREELNVHESNGGVYHDDIAGQIAARAVQTCMPSLASMRGERVLVEANAGISLQDSVASGFEGVRVEARLERVAIQSLVRILDESNPDQPLLLTTYDLFAVMRPRYVDPDPQDIVFGDELLIPFEEVRMFEPAQA